MTRKQAIRELKIQFVGEYDRQREAKDMAIKALEQEPRKGHWIMTSDYLTTAYGSVDYVKCSCCGEDSLEEGDYCPNCGADMRKVEE
jgi:uncharacterized OB-fold protein